MSQGNGIPSCQAATAVIIMNTTAVNEEKPDRTKKKEDEITAWQKIHQNLHSALLESVIPSSESCQSFNTCLHHM